MDISIILIAMIISQMYTYVKLIRLYTSDIYSLLYIKYISKLQKNEIEQNKVCLWQGEWAVSLSFLFTYGGLLSTGEHLFLSLQCLLTTVVIHMTDRCFSSASLLQSPDLGHLQEGAAGAAIQWSTSTQRTEKATIAQKLHISDISGLILGNLHH